MQAQLGSAKKQVSRIAATAALAKCTCQAARQPSRRASTSAVTLDDPSFFFYPSYTAAGPSSPRSHSPSRTRNRTRSRYSLLRRHDSRPLISSRYQIGNATPHLLSAGIARSQSTTSSEHVAESYPPPATPSHSVPHEARSHTSNSTRRHEQHQSNDPKGKARESEAKAAVSKAEAEADARLALEERIEDLYYERGTFQKVLNQNKLERACQLYEAVATDLHAHLKAFPPFEQEAQELVRALQQILPQLIRGHVSYSNSTIISGLLSFFEQKFNFPEVPFRQTPTTGSYNMLLQTYVQQLNVAKAFETVARMKRNRRDPTVRTWTLLITLYSHKRDPTSARNVFEEMIKAEIEPTQHSYTALMNAYTEAGQWDEAVDLFKFLDEHPLGHSLKPDIQTWTTLIKAYVLMGAPIDQVLNLYREILQRRLQPQGRTFTLILQAACDAGLTDLAEEIFAKMDRMDRVRRETEEPLANVYSFSVMIRGLMRAGKTDVAGEYYDEMRSRGIEPTSATWSILITAWAKGNDSDSSQVVQSLLDEFMETYINNTDPEKPKVPYKMDPNIARGLALQSVYGPVITAYAQMADIKSDNAATLSDVEEPTGSQERVSTSSGKDRALRTLQEMLSHPNSKPSVATYTALLDAYRRVDDVEGMLDIWKILVEFALDSTSRDYTQLLRGNSADQLQTEQPSIDPSRRNLLCLPLSILINGLSANHRHDIVADIWAEVQHRGFGYDASNFNHLAVAFVRAGELQRAFWTVETLLLQPELEKDETKPFNREDLKEVVDSPLQLDIAATETEVNHDADLGASLLASRVDTPIRPPNRAHELQPDFKRQLQRGHKKLRLPELDSDSDTLIAPVELREPDVRDLGSIDDTSLPHPHASADLAEEQTVTHLGTSDSILNTPELLSTETPVSVSLGEDRGASKNDSIAVADGVSASSVPILQENITASFQQMAKARKKALWMAHAATLTELEMALVRLERKGSEDKVGAAGDIQAQADSPARLAAQIRQDYPLTIRAIEEHRAKLNMVRGRLLRPL